LIGGLVSKTIREIALATWLFAMSLATMEGMFAAILPTFMSQAAEHWLQVSFVRKIISGVLGADVEAATAITAAAAIAWSHPIVVTMLWAQGIMTCTRLPAGEVDRGTIDTLLGLPVSRARLYVVDTLAPFLGGVFIVAMGVVGSVIGSRFVGPEQRFPTAVVHIITVNLFAEYVLVAGAACLVSSLSTRRGRAIGVVFAFVLASYVMHFLTPFWAFAKSIAPLNLLSYYQPMAILREGTWPIGDIAVLFGCGIAMWVAGAIIFNRRDICTV